MRLENMRGDVLGCSPGSRQTAEASNLPQTPLIADITVSASPTILVLKDPSAAAAPITAVGVACSVMASHNFTKRRIDGRHPSPPDATAAA